MQEEIQQPKKILEQFRSGQLGKSARSQVFSWLTHLDISAPTHSEELIAGRQQRSWQELEPALAGRSTAKLFKIPLWIKSAAAALLLLLSYGIWQYQGDKRTTETKLVWLETSTGIAEVKRISLSDGSVVTLNSKSRLRYPRVFGAGRRDIYLSGQGFFDVLHDTLRPFRVQARSVKIQVLGTSFEVKAYQDDPDLRVAVAAGKVGVVAKVSGKQKTVFLEQAEGLVYSLDDQSLRLTKPDPKELPYWQRHRLVYQNEPLADIARSLERHFEIRFIFKNEQLKVKRLSLDIKSAQLEIVIKALALSGDFKYKISKNTVAIW